MNTAATQSAASAQRSRRSWFSRNWLWLTPTVVLLVLVAAGGYAYVKLANVRWTPPYRMAVETVLKDAAVAKALGEPLKETTWIPSGEILAAGGRGEARLDFNVGGPKGKAHVRAVARMIDGEWGLTQLEATPEGGAAIRIDLRKEAGGNEAPAWTPPPKGKDNKTEDTPPPSIDMTIPGT